MALPMNGNYWDAQVDFGAAGTGAGNDTPPIQAGLNSLTGGGTVFFGPGTYNCRGGLTIPAGVHLLGAGWSSEQDDKGSILRLDPSIPSPLLVPFLQFNGAGGGMELMAVLDTGGKSATATVRGSAAGLKFLSNQIKVTNSTLPAFLLDSASRGYVTSGRVENTTGPAIKYLNNADCITTAVRMVGATTVFEQGNGDGGGPGNQFIGCRLSGSSPTMGDVTVALIHGSQTQWVGCEFDNGGPNGALVKIAPSGGSGDDTADGTSFTGCLFRNTRVSDLLKPAVLIQPTSPGHANDINFTGCRTKGDSLAHRFSSFISIPASGASGIIILGLTGQDCHAFYEGGGTPAKLARSIVVDTTGSVTRYPSENGGLYDGTGQGPLVFHIPHGLGVSPGYASVIPSTQQASSQKFYVTVDTTNVDATYGQNPGSPVKLYWEARIVP